MARENTFIGTKTGTLHMVPDGKEDEILWPMGTKHRQCIKSPSGHWMLRVSRWDKPKSTSQPKHAFPVEEDNPQVIVTSFGLMSGKATSSSDRSD